MMRSTYTIILTILSLWCFGQNVLDDFSKPRQNQLLIKGNVIKVECKTVYALDWSNPQDYLKSEIGSEHPVDVSEDAQESNEAEAPDHLKPDPYQIRQVFVMDSLGNIVYASHFDNQWHKSSSHRVFDDTLLIEEKIYMHANYFDSTFNSSWSFEHFPDSVVAQPLYPESQKGLKVITEFGPGGLLSRRTHRKGELMKVAQDYDFPVNQDSLISAVSVIGFHEIELVNGLKVKECLRDMGEMFCITFFYNEHGHVIKKVWSGEAMHVTVEETYTYIYDQHGNWIKRQSFVQAELSITSERTITYRP